MTALILVAVAFGLAAGAGGAATWWWFKHRERLDDRIKRILVEALAQMASRDIPTLPSSDRDERGANEGEGP